MLDIKQIKKMLIFLVGITILVFGIALLILPGPGILIIILGLTILAIEFVWAEALLIKLKGHAHKLKNKFH